MLCFYRHLLLALCPVLCPGPVHALEAASAPSVPSAPASKDMQIVQRIDDVLVGVDAVSLQILDRSHVAGSYFLINLHRPSPVVGTAEFVVDCQNPPDKPPRIATLASSLPSASLQPEPPVLQRRATFPDIAQLDFAPVHMLDGSWMVAEFACRSTSQPGRARQIAKELLEQGGPPDMRSLWCDLQVHGGQQMRRGVEVRFSQEDDAVAVNRQWLSSGFVSATEVVFGSGAQWVLDRRASRARLVGGAGGLLFSGACSARPPPSGQ